MTLSTANSFPLKVSHSIFIIIWEKYFSIDLPLPLVFSGSPSKISLSESSYLNECSIIWALIFLKFFQKIICSLILSRTSSFISLAIHFYYISTFSYSRTFGRCPIYSMPLRFHIYIDTYFFRNSLFSKLIGDEHNHFYF